MCYKNLGIMVLIFSLVLMHDVYASSMQQNLSKIVRDVRGDKNSHKKDIVKTRIAVALGVIISASAIAFSIYQLRFWKQSSHDNQLDTTQSQSHENRNSVVPLSEEEEERIAGEFHDAVKDAFRKWHNKKIIGLTNDDYERRQVIKILTTIQEKQIILGRQFAEDIFCMQLRSHIQPPKFLVQLMQEVSDAYNVSFDEEKKLYVLKT